MPYIMSVERIATQKGLEQGVLTDRREMVLEALDERFGEVPSSISETITQIEVGCSRPRGGSDFTTNAQFQTFVQATAYALVYGNPAKQHGWMCQRGTRLEFNNNFARCGICQREYRFQNNQVERL